MSEKGFEFMFAEERWPRGIWHLRGREVPIQSPTLDALVELGWAPSPAQAERLWAGEMSEDGLENVAIVMANGKPPMLRCRTALPHAEWKRLTDFWRQVEADPEELRTWSSDVKLTFAAAQVEMDARDDEYCRRRDDFDWTDT